MGGEKVEAVVGGGFPHALPQFNGTSRIVSCAIHQSETDKVGLFLVHARVGERNEDLLGVWDLHSKEPPKRELERPKERLLRHLLHCVTSENMPDLMRENSSQHVVGVGDGKDARIHNHFATGKDKRVGHWRVDNDSLPEQLLQLGAVAVHEDLAEDAVDLLGSWVGKREDVLFVGFLDLLVLCPANVEL